MIAVWPSGQPVDNTSPLPLIDDVHAIGAVTLEFERMDSKQRWQCITLGPKMMAGIVVCAKLGRNMTNNEERGSTSVNIFLVQRTDGDACRCAGPVAHSNLTWRY